MKLGKLLFLTVWRNNQGICVDSISSSRSISTHLFVEIGREMPLHCTAGSKVILANQPIEDIKKIVNKKKFLRIYPKYNYRAWKINDTFIRNKK